MDNQPYQAPQTPAANPDIPTIEAPAEILKKIKGGWIAAIISAVITVVFTLVQMQQNSLAVYNFIDVALIAGLAFGIFKKSRTCSTIMVVYFVAAKIYIMAQTGSPRGIIIALLFIYLYINAMIGTYQYHSWKKTVSPY